ncbi:MAG: phosphatidylinositol mannoside acyltransferase [Actinomycetota bacterium]|nr:phosphatidylinositol mannoside acyltransferase [Actinomycetota bacterium]
MLRRRVSAGVAFAAYRSGSAVARALPAGVAVALAGVLGAILRVALGGRLRMVRRHLQRAHGGRLSPAELEREVGRAFQSYARYWVESFRLPDLSPAEIQAGFVCEGMENLEGGLARGNGVILALPHLGGWDYGGAWLSTQGHPVTAVVEAIEPPELFEWFAGFRRSLGMVVVPLGPEAGPAVLTALHANKVVCLLSDRDVAGGGVEVEFFGERTTLPGGPLTLALRTGAVVLPTAVYFEGPTGHRAIIGPPLPLERQGRLRADVARGTQALAVELEHLIRRAPEQWHLFQPNWPSDREAATGQGRE